MKTTVYIEGMHCKNCMAKVGNKLSDLEGVKSAKVNLDKGIATLNLKNDLDNSVIKESIENLGYQVTDIK